VRSDLTGDWNTSDVSCECRVSQAYGVLCLHNVAQAHTVGIESHDFFHVKDRVETCVYVVTCIYVCLCICMHIHLYTRACRCTYTLV